MSKETASRDATVCPGCGGVFAHMPFHVDHCDRHLLGSDKPLTGIAAGIANTLESIGKTFPGVTPSMAKAAAEATVRSSGVASLLDHGKLPVTKPQRKGAKSKRTTGGKRG